MSKDEKELSNLRCVPCRSGVPPLKNEKINIMLKKVSNWNLIKEPVFKIQKTFKLKDFMEAMEFVNKVAEVAEEQGHHPDIFIHWNEVTLTLYTHAIDGLFDNDFIMAAKIDNLI